MKWSDLTNKQRNELIAATFFGWTPVQCDGDKAYVSISDYGEEMCHRCYAFNDDRDEDKLVHTIIPVEKDYIGSIEQALQVVQKAQSMLAHATLQTTLKSHGVHPVEVAFWWATSCEKDGYTYPLTRTVVEDCTLERLADCFCFVAAQSVEVVDLSEMEDE